jgi:HK97 family phage portal protein
MNKVQKAIARVLLGKSIPVNGVERLAASYGGMLVWSTNNDRKIITNGYLANDIVYSIINLVTNKAKIAPFNAYTVEDEQELKLYFAAMQNKDYKQAREHRHKALKLYNGDARLNELLKYPNEGETWADMCEQAYGYKLLTGDKYLYANQLSMGADQGKPMSLHVLPSHLMQIYSSDTFPAYEVGYQISYGYVQKLTAESVLHEKYWNPTWDVNGAQLYGLSPLRAACKNIDRSNSAKASSTAKFKNGGAEGFAYNDDEVVSGDEDLPSEQVGALKKAWQQEYSGPDNAGKIVFSGYKMGYTQVGLSPVDLNIIESEKWDLRMLCNIYGVTSDMLNDPDNKSQNNKIESEKALTSRCAIPLLTDHRDSLNRKLRRDWGYKNTRIILDFDTSVYGELQDREKDKASWLAMVPLTVRQRYEEIGREIPASLSEETLETLLVPANLRDFESLGLSVPDIAGSADQLGKMNLL